MEAIWGTDYDPSTDTLYRRPMCPECMVGIAEAEDGEYHCFSCNEIVYVTDQEMKEWFSLRDQTMTRMGNCLRCGQKDSMERHYRKNPVTLDWQMAYGKCKYCGTSFIG